MKTPDVIYLIDMGDEIAWCDDPNPSGDYEPDDSVAYVKKDHRDALIKALKVMTSLVRIKYGNLDADVNAEIEKAEAAIAVAKGEV